MWLESYGTYYHDWARNSVGNAHKLCELFPHLVHIEKESLNHPTFLQLDDLYQRHYNITQNYCLHIYGKTSHYVPGNPNDLDGYDCTVGDALRLVLYDKYDIRSNVTSNGHKI